MTSAGRRSRAQGAVGLIVASAAGVVVTVAFVYGSDVLSNPHANAAARGLAIALCGAVGAYTWWRRPDSTLGALVAAIGLIFSVASLMAFQASLPFTLGRLALAVFILYAAYVFVCFPRDHPAPGVERTFTRAMVLANAFVWALALTLTNELPVGGPLAQCAGACPLNALQLVSVPSSVAHALTATVSATTAITIAGATVVLVGKARAPNRLRRRAVEPLLWIMSATTLAYATYIVLRQVGVRTRELPAAIVIAGFLSMPLGMLVGQIRGRIFAATRLGRLVITAGDAPVTPQRVEAMVSEALGDPTLKLALWSPERGAYVDARGSPIDVLDTAERTVTRVTRDGHPSAAIIHDSGLDRGEGMTEGVAATAMVLLENTRLVEALRASRARIADAAQQERLRLERDLHDGAQQRLMAIQIKLSLVRDLDDPAGREAALHELDEDATAAVEELRTLAHGIYPPLLRERGLRDALSSMAAGSPMSVSVRCHGTVRYPPAIEAAVYFSVLEAMQNAMKHAGSGAHLELSVECADAGVSFAVADDGSGFDVAFASEGLGLVSMQDRMDAVGGMLHVTSSASGGTTVSGQAPAEHGGEETRPWPSAW